MIEIDINPYQIHPDTIYCGCEPLVKAICKILDIKLSTLTDNGIFIDHEP